MLSNSSPIFESVILALGVSACGGMPHVIDEQSNEQVPQHSEVLSPLIFSDAPIEIVKRVIGQCTLIINSESLEIDYEVEIVDAGHSFNGDSYYSNGIRFSDGVSECERAYLYDQDLHQFALSWRLFDRRDKTISAILIVPGTLVDICSTDFGDERFTYPDTITSLTIQLGPLSELAIKKQFELGIMKHEQCSTRIENDEDPI